MGEERGRHGQWRLFVVLGVAGLAAVYFNVPIPHTDVIIDGRWAIGFIGFALLTRGWMALLLAALLSLPLETGIPVWIGLSGNLLYALPSMLVIRAAHPRMLRAWGPGPAYGAGWFVLVLALYQAFTTPVVWGITAAMQDRPVLQGVLAGWRTQPFLVESVLVGLMSAAALVAVLTRRRLSESEERYRALVMQSPDCLLLHDLEGRILDVNPCSCRTYGYTRDELLRMKVSDLDPDYDARAEDGAFYDRIPPGESMAFEARQRTRDGRIFPAEIRVTLIEHGGATLAQGLCRDISERKRAEEAVARSRAELKAIYENAPVMTCVLDERRRVVYANSAFTAFTGTTEEELLHGHACGVFGCINALEDERGCGHGTACPDCALLRALEDTRDTGVSHRNVEASLTLERDGAREEITLLGSTARIDVPGDGIRLLLCLNDVTALKRAEEAVRAEHERLEFIIEGANVGTWVHHLKTGQTEYNELWARMFGYTLDELQPTTTHTWRGLAHPEDLEKALDVFGRYLAGETPLYECEMRMRHKDGHWVWVLDRGRIITRDADGHPESMFGTHTDITAVKRTEEALNRKHAMLARTEAVAHVGSWEWEAEGDKVTWSEELFRIFGLEPAEEAPTFAEHQAFYAPEDRARLVAAIDECMRTGAPYDLEVRVTRSDGALRHCVVRGYPVRDADGAVTGLYGSLDDITDIRRSEERIALLGRMLDVAPASITVHDMDGRFLYANEETFRLHGWSRDEFMALNLHDLDVPESAARIAERMRKIEEEGEARFEVFHHRKDGSTFPLEVMAKRITWEGKPALLSVAADITERKELAFRNQRLADVVERSQDFIGVADLNRNAVYVNAAGQALVGLDGDDAVRQTKIDDYFFPEDLPFVRETIIPALETEGRWAGEFRFRHFKTGQPIPVLYDLFHTVDPDTGKPTNITTITRDITERKEAERRLRLQGLVLDQIMDCVTVTDLDGTITYVNEAEVKALGRSRQELVGESVTRYGEDPARGASQRQIIEETLRLGHWRGHVVNCTADGTEIIMDCRTRVVLDESGEAVALSGIATDVTGQIRLERELRERNAFIEAILDNLPIGLAVNKFSEETATYMNKAFEAIYGWPADKLRNIPEFFECVYPDPQYRAQVEQRIREDIASDDPSRLRWEGIAITRRDGSRAIVSATNIPLLEQDMMISTVQDETQRYLAEQALRASEERFRSFVENANDIVYALDPDGVFTYISPNWIEFMGEPVEAALGRSFETYTHAEDVEACRAFLRDVITSGTPQRGVEYRVLHRDGSIRWHMSNGAPLRDSEGRVTGYIGIGRDVTEAKLAEEEREKLREQLQQSQKMESIGRLAGGVAHDFNNMLNVILGHAELLLEDLPAGHELRGDVEQVQAAARRSADLTGQLLAFARKQTVSPKVLDLNETVSSMLSMLRRLIGEDIALTWRPGDGLEPVHIDPAQMDQLLANLVVNARDAIGPQNGTLVIETGMRDLDQEYCLAHPDLTPGRYVVLCVSDDGCGMDEETRQQIFEPFFTTKGVGEGTGLGLATVYGIVRQNGGLVEVDSAPGNGSSFRIYLPPNTRTVDAAAESAPAETPRATGGETILMVEDEPGILNLGSRMLERLGYRVLTAATPGGALRVAREHAGEIHLLITDVVMPEMNGRELARQLLSLYPHVARLFMSGYTADVIANQGVLEQGVNFIQKPFSMRSLGAKVRETLERAHADTPVNG